MPPSSRPSGRATLLPFPCRNSTFLLNRSEVGPGGRGTEAGHGLRGRVDKWRKPLDSEKHREPEGDLRRKVMEAAAARLRPHAPPYSGPRFLTWDGGGGSRENLVAGSPELRVCNDLRAVLCSLPDLGPAPKSASYREMRWHLPPPPTGSRWAGLAREAPPLSAYAGGRERKWNSPGWPARADTALPRASNRECAVGGAAG